MKYDISMDVAEFISVNEIEDGSEVEIVLNRKTVAVVLSDVTRLRTDFRTIIEIKECEMEKLELNGIHYHYCGGCGESYHNVRSFDKKVFNFCPNCGFIIKKINA